MLRNIRHPPRYVWLQAAFLQSSWYVKDETCQSKLVSLHSSPRMGPIADPGQSTVVMITCLTIKWTSHIAVNVYESVMSDDCLIYNGAMSLKFELT